MILAALALTAVAWLGASAEPDLESMMLPTPPSDGWILESDQDLAAMDLTELGVELPEGDTPNVWIRTWTRDTSAVMVLVADVKIPSQALHFLDGAVEESQLVREPLVTGMFVSEPTGVPDEVHVAAVTKGRFAILAQVIGDLDVRQVALAQRALLPEAEADPTSARSAGRVIGRVLVPVLLLVVVIGGARYSRRNRIAIEERSDSASTDGSLQG